MVFALVRTCFKLPLLDLTLILALFSMAMSPIAVADTSTTKRHATYLANALSMSDANVIFMRHALAPGFGDPASFQVNDCSTQRNLNDSGRNQARQLGQILVASNIAISTVLSSEWCRCWQTAELLGLGEWQKFAGLNSFFDGHADRDETLALLRQYLGKLPSKQITLMVTHQVVISAITGIAPTSGGMVLFDSKTGHAERLTFP